ncbi:MAG: hypothetical protein ING91_19410 [Rhodocyclaceae bacterium]|nr:hypothetical protein [Rhodocyclaceae bacterium]MCA3116403.1 hypothetical protein [Rhodocyclaceae bacterium]MCA3129188.1 hypothetical protein [Rhodocyclaceae bacterium]
MTVAEREHVTRVKALDCVVCGTGGVTEAHEPVQGLWWCAIALCPDCHRGPKGWHGDRAMFRIRKWDQWDALNETLRRLM